MKSAAARAVVFAYHNVGVRGLAVLLANDVKVDLVVTHEDNPAENIWFGSVSALARLNDIPVITPKDPNHADIVARVKACQAEFIFSFYYRHMLGAEILNLATRGAYNLHGSLLPQYRGRAPVNWAVLHGESETGATLHRMVVKPDAGSIVDQQAVPILPNDTAHDVFQKVTYAAEQLLVRTVPKLLAGSAIETPQDLSLGKYFGGRKPEDGRIDWHWGAWPIHNLIRTVAPPYPGAFFDLGSDRIHLLGSYYRKDKAQSSTARLYWQDNRCWVDCADGERLLITELAINNQSVDVAGFQQHFGRNELQLF